MGFWFLPLDYLSVHLSGCELVVTQELRFLEV